MPRDTNAEELAAFVSRVAYEDLSGSARFHLKAHILDSFGCALGAIGSDPLKPVLEQTDEFGGASLCSLIGGQRSAPDRAAFYNSALIRYLDFNDSYLAKKETCHPSDNLGAVLAACEYARASGRTFMTALAVAYQVQCRLSDVAPVRDKGFDHTTQGSYALAAGVSKALSLDPTRTASALAMCGTAFNALRVTRTGKLSNWKGLAYPNTAFGCVHAAFLAMRGITGPLEVFEGNKGFMDSIAGYFEIDWSQEDLERVTHTILKKYNAEIHSQSAIEGILEMKREHGFVGSSVERIDLDIFDVAFHIIGGGEEGDKSVVETKEAADHSLPYLLAVAVLDGEVMPAQYEPARIRSADVQDLLQKVRVKPSHEFSQLFPQALACRITVRLKDGSTLTRIKRDYEGFVSRPMHWNTVVEKFHALSGSHAGPALRARIVDAVHNLEHVPAIQLMTLLRQASTERLREEELSRYGGT